jgi:hypothetical protein
MFKNKNQEWVTGNWKQKDLVISVGVKIGGQKIPAGTSMIALAPLIGQALGSPEIAAAILCTADNIYSFNADGTYKITGCTDLILPVAGYPFLIFIFEHCVFICSIFFTGCKKKYQ